MPGISRDKVAIEADDDLLEREWNVWNRNELHTSSPPTTSTGPLATAGQYFKMVIYSVKELQMSEYSHSRDKYFTFNNNPFVYVYLSGTIVSVNTHKDKLCMEVHDGTASIKCLIEDEMLNKIEKERAKYNARSTHSLHDGNFDEPYQAMARIFFQATLKLIRNVPVREEICVGKTVSVMGKLTEHNGTRYVFVVKINSISVEDHLKNIQCFIRSRYQNDECEEINSICLN